MGTMQESWYTMCALDSSQRQVERTNSKVADGLLDAAHKSPSRRGLGFKVQGQDFA